MINKIKEYMSNTQPVVDALKDLHIYSNDNQFQSQQLISNRLRSFFETQQSKKLFLQSLFEVVQKESVQEGNLQRKFKILLLLHIILSSQVGRSELSKILISKQVNLKTQNPISSKLGVVCQHYYHYLYKLASQTTFINEEVVDGDLLIYFTLSNQCYIGMGMQKIIENVDSFQTNPLLANIIKFIYYDLQDIFIFILKDIKCLIENKEETKYSREQMLELYKECQVLQKRMLDFYRFNRHFDHFQQIMPPYSLAINKESIGKLLNSQPKMNSLQQIMNQQESHHLHKQQPQTSKQKNSIKFEFKEMKRQQSDSIQFSFSN
ncbi:unnamed protein product (macronuclear) [Paramecium tetraurelia]|uniref:AP180 N-terminal homology (ANTH) domain-containing protein n=1 Tax=Paramecium tetraurelia TaxID=5888 RepID=A0D190_PARTE|nr:uncharacterized protein GSPATT00012331001 [Paramecium tetraurelia]CAK76807.1 unnamed protein product [Paramecium tetraurelia]|eukprot:XP_001444204.1 hypothetical protein (macronuclear) [Paramecium tetraurelia strain d4-2]